MSRKRDGRQMLMLRLSNMVRKESDTTSMTSGTSKGSDRRKGSRLSSIQSILFRRSSRSRVVYTSKKSQTAASTSSSGGEAETTSSESSISARSHPFNERDMTLQSLTPSPVPRSTSMTSHQGSHRCENGMLECPLCFIEQEEEHFPTVMTCDHRSCRSCLQQYLKIEITESRVDIACPECSEKFHPNDIRMILEDDSLMLKFEEFTLRRVLVTDADVRWCPAPDCGYAVIASGCASCPKLHCERPGCNTNFCYHCKQYWHPNQTCDAARAERMELSPNMRSSSLSYSHDSGGEIKPCPRCGAYIIKMDDGSCNHMTCAVCGAEFCWLCMKEISDLHYLSPSGCTFWGKKPWSRKKKILWQLGTLVGAPVGIALVAGIAVPAMIIGIPVWVGRKINARYTTSPKHKRNLAIAGGVTASILISPVVAGLAVGIGVPILLAYVYGVVPISLCRSGGCGVTTTNSGVRFEFEEENEGATAGQGNYGGDTHSIETSSHRVANPSIGPSIGEVSMAMTNSLSASGSHMDRVGVIRDESDRDSASNRALAGASLNGSLSGSAVAGPSGFQNRLEVHADVATSACMGKRASFSSESANFSLSEKSAILPCGDDASMKALAGSIIGGRDNASISSIIPPLDVHIDINETSQSKSASNHGSPISGRSVTFCEEGKGHHGKKRHRHRSRSFGDKIHEHSEHPEESAIERLSMHSLALDESSAETSPRDADGDSSCNGHQAVVIKHGGLTEVESDRPEGYNMRTIHKTIPEDDKLVEGPVLCNIFEEKYTGPSSTMASDPGLNRKDSRGGNPRDCDKDIGLSRAASDGLRLSDDNLSFSQSRRKSCQLAMMEGRLLMDIDQRSSDIV
ncbi:E3 ubiquitin-protein ligase RNF19A-like isoform X2 [Lineus longissimus]|uniref:E3 ubiquitin-protein ligase RNF19A-like isoform X2 n=1 Tax=Lineus longissimus TaxID=88925 RepID=UPI00315CABA7